VSPEVRRKTWASVTLFNIVAGACLGAWWLGIAARTTPELVSFLAIGAICGAVIGILLTVVAILVAIAAAFCVGVWRLPP
jgi:hypothetical protein